MHSLDEYSPSLAQMVAKLSYLPHPDTVRALNGAAFPTARARRLHPRLSLILKDNEAIGMYDDNTTPTWALLWSHGIVGGQRKGWGFAHVWQVSDDTKSYTNIANLALIPECFTSLTDKEGPLTSYLRWHAWVVYGWKPVNKETPSEPPEFDKIKWIYLERNTEPRQFINKRMLERNNDRVRILRPIMVKLGMS